MTEATCKCGAPLSEGAAFCSTCGQRVAESPSSTSGKGWILIAVVGVIAFFVGGFYLLRGAEEDARRRTVETARDADRAEQELRVYQEAGRQLGDGSAPTYGSNDREVILHEYNLLQSGISYEEAERIIGFPGTEISSTDLGGIRTIMFAWSNPDGSNMNAMFQNGRLIQKAQFGLR